MVEKGEVSICLDGVTSGKSVNCLDGVTSGKMQTPGLPGSWGLIHHDKAPIMNN